MFEVFGFSFISALIITGFFLLFVKISGIEKLLLEKIYKDKDKGEDSNEK